MRALLALAISTQVLAPKTKNWCAFVPDPNGQNMAAVCHGPGRA
jgi:hypothetical protein